MLVAVSTGNLGVMWVAIEATTVTSALLIPLRRTRASVDASWKYLLIGSVGIALAFTGTVLAYVDLRDDRRRRQRGASLDDARASRRRRCIRRWRDWHSCSCWSGFGTKAGTGADAHVAARRALGSAVVAVGDDVRCAARGRVVRDRALEGDHRSRDRLGLQRHAADRRRRGDGGRRQSQSAVADPLTNGCSRSRASSTWDSRASGSRSDHLGCSRRCCT